MPHQMHEFKHDSVSHEFLLQPSRSLDARGKKIFYGSLITAGALTNYFAISAGVWPIAVTVDIALAGAAFAMMLSTRSGYEYERIEIAKGCIRINHYAPGFEEEKQYELPLYMLKVEAKTDGEHCSNLFLKSGTKRFEFGAFLPPEEKEQVAKALGKALAESQQAHHLKKEI